MITFPCWCFPGHLKHLLQRRVRHPLCAGPAGSFQQLEPAYQATSSTPPEVPQKTWYEKTVPQKNNKLELSGEYTCSYSIYFFAKKWNWNWNWRFLFTGSSFHCVIWKNFNLLPAFAVCFVSQLDHQSASFSRKPGDISGQQKMLLGQRKKWLVLIDMYNM